MNNATWKAFGSAPSPAFVLNLQGRIMRHRAWLDPDETREVLDQLLAKNANP